MHTSLHILLVICTMVLVGYLSRQYDYFADPSPPPNVIPFQAPAVATAKLQSPIEVGAFTVKQDGNRIAVIHNFTKKEIAFVIASNINIAQVAQLVSTLNAEFERGKKCVPA